MNVQRNRVVDCQLKELNSLSLVVARGIADATLKYSSFNQAVMRMNTLSAEIMFNHAPATRLDSTQEEFRQASFAEAARVIERGSKQLGGAELPRQMAADMRARIAR
jgi:hypothetical protein